ncbi:MAG: hypothetical protein ACYTFG_13400 [Planctomycetota bacterium]|jgi:hypothetical protein
MKLVTKFAIAMVGILGIMAGEARAEPEKKGRKRYKNQVHHAGVHKPARARSGAQPIQHVVRHRHGRVHSCAQAQKQARERQEKLARARRSKNRSGQLTRQAGEIDAMRTRILNQIRNMQRHACECSHGRRGVRNMNQRRARNNRQQQAIDRMLNLARELGKSRDRLLARAKTLKDQAQRIMKSLRNRRLEGHRSRF